MLTCALIKSKWAQTLAVKTEENQLSLPTLPFHCKVWPAPLVAHQHRTLGVTDAQRAWQKTWAGRGKEKHPQQEGRKEGGVVSLSLTLWSSPPWSSGCGAAQPTAARRWCRRWRRQRSREEGRSPAWARCPAAGSQGCACLQGEKRTSRSKCGTQG